MVSIKHALKQYGDKTALNIQTLDIPQGECFGLVGNNGAGKTTFFRALLDLIPLDEGKVEIDNMDVSRVDDWKRRVGAYLDEGFLIDFLRPEEFFYFVGNTRGLSQAEVDEQLRVFEPIFKNEVLGRKRYIRDLSKGNQKKVGIVAAFIGKPSLVVLDEPFANLDPSSQFQLRETIKQLVEKSGVTALISSHDLTHVTEVCNRIVILNEGVIVKDLKTEPQTLQALEQFFQHL